MLTKCQENAIEAAKKSYKTGRFKFGLFGAGGVGKTFVANALIGELMKMKERKLETLLLAPTNSALKSLKKSFAESTLPGLTFKTIHSALGLQPEYDNLGRQQFLNKIEIDWQYDIIFVDEASMVSESLAIQILELSKQIDAFLICSGDRPQLFPVNEKSSYLMENMDNSYELVTSVRQDINNPISEVIKDSRNAVLGKTENYDPRREFSESMTNEQKEGYYVYWGDNKGMRQIIRAYTKAYEKQDFSFVKMVAYTNKQCQVHNSTIRTQLWGEFAASSPYIKGDLVVCKSPVIQEQINPYTGLPMQVMVITTGTEMIVQDVRVTQVEYQELVLESADSILGRTITQADYVTTKKNEFKIVTYKAWELTVKEIDNSNAPQFTVTVIDPLEQSKFLGNRLRYKNEAKEYDQKLNRNFWFRFYNHEKILDNFSHSYCVTAHFTQGKTFNIVGVDAVDITVNTRDTETSLRAMYVALSRAKKFIIMI